MIGLALALGGCAVAPPTVTPDDDIAVLSVASWSAGTAARTRVEVQDRAGTTWASDWQDSEPVHRAPLLGLPPGTELTARVVSEAGDESESVAFTTGVPPAELPGWTTSGEPGWEGYLLLGVISDPSWAVILDQDGRVVWYKKAAGGRRVLRVRASPDGQGLRYAEIQEAAITESSQLVTVEWDGTEVSRQTVPEFNHDFVDAADGGALCLVTDVRPGRSGADVTGDALAHVQADGTLTKVWTTWDQWEVPGDEDIEPDGTWTHANALDVREGGGVWLGMRNQSQLLELDEAYTLQRILGGEDSDWSFAAPADRPVHQHQFQVVDGGMVLFDDRDVQSGEPSRALELALDDTTMSATATWSWSHPKDIQVYALGDVDRAADGSTLVVFSSAGILDDLGADGDLRWELATDLGAGLSYAVRLEALPGMVRVQ